MDGTTRRDMPDWSWILIVAAVLALAVVVARVVIALSPRDVAATVGGPAPTDADAEPDADDARPTD
jgi:hypothetical protein